MDLMRHAEVTGRRLLDIGGVDARKVKVAPSSLGISGAQASRPRNLLPIQKATLGHIPLQEVLPLLVRMGD